MKEGILTWCDENGDPLVDEKILKRAKRTGNAYLKIVDNYNPSAITGLPTPYELTGDPEWNVGGKMLKLYDLELDKRSGKVFGGVNGVFNTPLNTSDDSEPVDCIPEFADEDAGVKVLSENSEEKEIKKEVSKQNIRELIRTSRGRNGEIADPKQFNQLATQIGNVMNNGVVRIAGIGKTPQLCRTGCKHYDGLEDVNDGEFKEYCCQRGMTKIDNGHYCACFEGKEAKLPEGVLPI